MPVYEMKDGKRVLKHRTGAREVEGTPVVAEKPKPIPVEVKPAEAKLPKAESKVISEKSGDDNATS